MKITDFKAAAWQVIMKVSPLAHRVLPAGFRRKLGAAARLAVTKDMLPVPAPYTPGRYPAGYNLFGLFKAEMGLAQGAKLYADALEAGGIPHTLLNLEFLNSRMPQNDTAYDARLQNEAKYAVNLVHINPDEWTIACYPFGKQAFDGHYNIGVWLWELETVPRTWLPVLKYVDEIWAPSEFIARALRKETEKPVTVIPYGISVPWDETVTRTELGLPEDAFLVLTMFDSNSYSSRKNPAAAVEAFARAFGVGESNAHLVIKVNHPSPEDLAFFEKTLGKDGRYTLITERMDKKRLNAMIRLCDVFISLHRSEGFGLVMAEAMALRTAVVSTNWSANVEFMPPEAACMVDYTLVPVGDQYQRGEGIQNRWADADTDQAAEYLRRLHDDPAYRRQKTDAGYRYISQHLTPARSAEKMRRRLSEILEQK